MNKKVVAILTIISLMTTMVIPVTAAGGDNMAEDIFGLNVAFSAEKNGGSDSGFYTKTEAVTGKQKTFFANIFVGNDADKLVNVKRSIKMIPDQGVSELEIKDTDNKWKSAADYNKNIIAQMNKNEFPEIHVTFSKAGNYTLSYSICDASDETIITRTLTITVVELSEECDHDYKITIKEPTCTEEGYSIYECTKCGEVLLKDKVLPIGHKYIISTINPTCEEEGYTLHECEVCGDTYKDDYIVRPGHVYSKKVVKPTCTVDGYTLYECDYCGYTYKDNIVKATGHQYVDTIVKPTISSQGYTIHTCNKCGDTYKNNYTAQLGNTASKDNTEKLTQVTVKKTSFKSIKNVKGKKAKVSIKKVSGVNGYEIQYSTNKKFKKAVKKVNTKKISYTVKKLKKKQKYYFRVRAYKTVDGKTYYSDWSKVKSLKIKK